MLYSCLVIFSALLSFKGPAGHSLVVNANIFYINANMDDDCRNQWIELFDCNEPYKIVPRYDVPLQFHTEMILHAYGSLNLDFIIIVVHLEKKLLYCFCFSSYVFVNTLLLKEMQGDINCHK